MHRLGRFAAEHPDIDLRVSATIQHVDFAREDVDLAVRHGDGNWAGLDAVRLCSERLFPVCAPKLVSGRNRVTKDLETFFNRNFEFYGRTLHFSYADGSAIASNSSNTSERRRT